MGTYTAVVTLMQDLEQLVRSYDRIFGSGYCTSHTFSLRQEVCPISKEELEILYHNFSFIHSFLTDYHESRRRSYNNDHKELMLEKRIGHVAHKAATFLEFWAVQCLSDKPTLAEQIAQLRIDRAIIEDIASIGTEITEERRAAITDGTSTTLLTEMVERNPTFILTEMEEERSAAITYGTSTITEIVEFARTFILTEMEEERRAIIEDTITALLTEIVRRARTSILSEMDEERRVIIEGTSTILTEIAQEMSSINKELKKIHDDRKVQDLQDTASTSTGKSFAFSNPSRRAPNTEGKLVGLENDLVTMLDSLTGQASQLKVFSIIGMAGIGKTTFAKKLYDHPLVMHHFYIRAWITVSQQYQVKEMLLGVLRCVSNVSVEIYEKCEEELREQVYKTLKGKRYLIVLDDMWDTKAWDDLRITFPDDKNGSRIMLTSRLRDIAVHASQNIPPHCLRCLSADESWELLCSKIFVNESCPMEFVEIGKQIAFKCQGLPLALVVLGGLLSKMNKKLDVWEEVAKSKGPLVMEDAEQCQNVLALSYNHLPDHLKPCFLYMGIFPEDYDISVKKLIYLWVAEGFIRPRKEKSLEEVPEEYLEDLVTRSLVFVKGKRSNGRIKICYIHDLMRNLCLRESQKQNFLHVINNYEQLPLKSLHHDNLLVLGIIGVPQNSLRRLSFHSNIRMYIGIHLFPYTRSILFFDTVYLSDRRAHLGMNLKLLKVLDIMNIHLNVVPDEILCLTQLKYLALTVQYSLNISNFASMFQSLQIVIIDCEDVDFTISFCNMPELRHFHLKRSCLAYSPTSSSVSDILIAETAQRVQNNLQSLSTLRPISCTKKVFLGMPNLKKLGVCETEDDHLLRGWFEELVYIKELETLKYTFTNPFVSSRLKPCRLPLSDNFPQKLVKLNLSGTSFPWKDMLKLSKLPKLEVLKLRNYAFSGPLWESREGGFPCLKFLLIGSTDLEIWEADGTHFPKLEQLVLRHCRYLKEIPYGIGEAPLLENIALHCCKDSAVMSARNLQEEQESMGNDGLTLHITEH